MRTVWGLHAKDSQNVGDRWCSPVDYFPFPGGQTSDIRADLSEVTADAVIIGGGALVRNMSKKRLKERGLRIKKRIAWGVGYTKRGHMGWADEHKSRGFALYGNRDYGSRVGEYVPCASCMHPAFDREYSVEHDLVFYGHAELSRLEVDRDWPQMANDNMDIDAVIAFLGSGDTIVTSSYHGVYWSLLLGRKVVAVPFGSKFFTFKYPIPLVQDWRGVKGVAYPEALDESRDINRSFYRKVMEYLS